MRPDPVGGQIVRFDYVFRSEAISGHIEGVKTRPCAVVVAVKNHLGRFTVTLAAISHTPPANGQPTIEIPHAVKAHLGMDDARSWVLTGEVNIADWSEAGFTPLPDGRWNYGHMPPKLAERIRSAVVEHFSAGKLAVTTRRS